MVTRARDLDNFIHADPRDVRVFEYQDGLSFACYGLTPERRLVLESVYGKLTLKNGVPIGYVLASGLFGSSEVMYNVFETFRGGESARIYGRVLSMARVLFGADTFAIDPFQLGHANPEGQKSGAFWFYHKLGFRPVAPKALALVQQELERLAANPRVRSSPRTLHRLAAEYVFCTPPGRAGTAGPGDARHRRPPHLAPAGRAGRGRPRGAVHQCSWCARRCDRGRCRAGPRSWSGRIRAPSVVPCACVAGDLHREGQGLRAFRRRTVVPAPRVRGRNRTRQRSELHE